MVNSKDELKPGVVVKEGVRKRVRGGVRVRRGGGGRERVKRSIKLERNLWTGNMIQHGIGENHVLQL